MGHAATRTRSTRSIRTRVQLLVVACIVPAWLLAMVLAYLTYQRERDNRIAATVQMARALSQQADRELSTSIAVLQTLATANTIEEGDYTRFHERASEVMKVSGGDNIVLFDTSLQGLVSVRHTVGAPLPRVRQDRLPQVMASGRPAVSEIFIGEVSNKAQVAVAVPVMRAGAVVGRLEMLLSPRRFAAILDQQAFPASWTAAVLDNRGTIVARTRDAERFIGKPVAPVLLQQLALRSEGSFLGRTADGIDTIGCFSRSAAHGWSVAIGLPLDVLHAELARTLGLVATGGVGLLAVGLLLARRMSRQISEPVQALVAPALAIGRGEAATLRPSTLKEATEVGAALLQAQALLLQREQARQQAEAALRDSQSRLRMALDASQIGDWDYDLRTRVLQRSARHDQIFGYPEPQADWGVDDFVAAVHPQDRERVQAQMQQVLANRQPTWHYDCRIVWPDGSIHWLSTRGSLVFEHGEPVRMLGIVTDITELRQAEDLRVQRVRLEAENRQVHEASRLKSEFLANMSHELRTPLNAVIGFAEILRTATLPPDSPKRDEYLGHILAGGRHLLELINDVLDLAKVESGKFELFPEPLDLPHLVDEVVGVLQAEATRKRISVSIDLAAGLTGLVLDPARLKQVLYNFLSNAIKFTEPGGQVWLRSRAEEPAHFRIEVEDTGIGISLADQQRLFVPFQQVSAGPTKQHGGTGLGLALTRRLAELHGGTVGLRSRPGAGSVFHIVLPRRAGPPAEEPARP